MKAIHRKTTTKVIYGKVQKKNRWALSPNYYNTSQPLPFIDREDPGSGFRHILRKNHIIDFIELLPDWDELSKGLNAIVLANGRNYCDGWYRRGVVAICAWDRDLWRVVRPGYYQEHRKLFENFGVPCERKGEDYLLKFNEPAVRAYQLLHIFLHELGHHHDRMTTRSKASSSRGETYAEQYAIKYSELIWDRYLRVFKLD